MRRMVRSVRDTVLMAALMAVLGGTGIFGDAVQAQPVPAQRPAPAQVDVVALRVEFEPDTTRFTTGDGTFGGALFDASLSPSVDPLPHDAAYFEAHLSFLEHYVSRVSDGQTQVEAHLVPGILRVSQPMASYSPTGPNADSPAEREKLYALIREAWTQADAEVAFDASQLDPEHTVFVLFHAGVGRDVELIGTTLDKTPQDLPSLSLAGGAFREAVGADLTFKDLPVTNTLIVPRTETRQGTDVITDEPFLLELSINGLLAASFFNALGVPDLFNTETGETAIGTFGLMDPNGIFAFRGLFPPEPSAWTKYFLGWTEPQVVTGADVQTVTLRAAGLANGSDVARVPISNAEYFLVETRHRDPEGDGLVLQVWQDGEIVEQRVQNGDEEFDGVTSIDGFIGGVVVAVDNYDWALPGGVLRDGTGDPVLDEDGNTIPLNGGMLIWHIDERRFADGTLNDDPERRAVDLEEADSAQDIGFDSPSAVAAGSPFDFWYEGNSVTAITSSGREVRLYENRFGLETQPSSATNAGGPSFITLEEFSPLGVEMTVTYRQVQEGAVQALYSTLLGPESTPPNVGEQSAISRFPEVEPPLANYDTLLVYANGDMPSSSGIYTGTRFGLRDSFTGGDAIFERPAIRRNEFLWLRNGRQGEPWKLLATSRIGVDVISGSSVEFPESLSESQQVSAPVLGANSFDAPIHVLFSSTGSTSLTSVFWNPERPEEQRVEVEPVEGIGRGLDFALTGGSLEVIVGDEGTRVGDEVKWVYTLAAADTGQPAFGRDRSGLVGIIPVVGEHELLWLLADGTTRRIDVTRYADGNGAMNAFPVLADLDADGRLDVVTTVGTSLLAFSQGGALVSGFPIVLDAPSVAQPLVATLSDSGGWSLVIAATDGNVYAYDTGRGGALVDSFPLAVGASVEATPLLQDQTLYAVSTGGTLKAWRLEALGDIWWGQLYANAQNQSFVALDATEPTQPPASSGLLVDAETYNWPNPIQDGQTFLRCMTTADAQVEVTIIDAAGQQVEAFEMRMQGGIPAEHQWQTSASSGLYYARFRATADDGTTDTQLVKMAIIR